MTGFHYSDFQHRRRYKRRMMRRMVKFNIFISIVCIIIILVVMAISFTASNSFIPNLVNTPVPTQSYYFN